jgi:hypothetical protein
MTIRIEKRDSIRQPYFLALESDVHWGEKLIPLLAG